MQARFRGVALAMTVAAVLSLGVVAGAFADRGGKQGSHGHSNQSASAAASDNNGSSTAKTHPDNHGGDVSDAAHSIPPGPGHGEEVSEVAQDNHGHEGGGDDGDDNTPTATPPGTVPFTPTTTATPPGTVPFTPTATETPPGTTPFTPTATATAAGTVPFTATATATATATEVDDEGGDSDEPPETD